MLLWSIIPIMNLSLRVWMLLPIWWTSRMLTLRRLWKAGNMNGLHPFDYVNKGIKALAFWDRIFAGYVWNKYTSIHPKTESQYQRQMFLRGISPWYDSWMVNRSADERNRTLRGMYGIKFTDVTYPHLSGVMSENTTKVLGGASWQFSKNLANLYK